MESGLRFLHVGVHMGLLMVSLPGYWCEYFGEFRFEV